MRWHVSGELHGSFLNAVADQTLLVTMGYGLKMGRRWQRWGIFGLLEQNLWLPTDYAKSLKAGVFNFGVGGEFFYAGGHMRASVAAGPSILLYDTPLDGAGSAGFFVDMRPAGIRWDIGQRWAIIADLLSLNITAPVLSGIPLALMEYRTTVSFEGRF